MLVNNFYTLMRMGMLFGSWKNSPLKLINTSGALATVVLGSDRPDYYAPSKYNPAYEAFAFPPSDVATSVYDEQTHILLGSGVGAATVDDYALQQPIYDGFTASVTQNPETVDSSGYCFGEAIINIIATKSIVIGELGFVYAGDYLLDRTVLDTPVSLKEGQTATIKYRITNASTLNA